MSNKNTKKRLSTFGRRTGVDVRAGKRIRVHHDGREQFDDYWTSSDESNFDHHEGSKCSSPTRMNPPRMSSFIRCQTPSKEFPRKISFQRAPSISSVSCLNADKRKLFTKGRRTGKDLFAGKEVIKDKRFDNFDDYFTDSSAVTSINNSRISGKENSIEHVRSNASLVPPSPRSLRYLSRNKSEIKENAAVQKLNNDLNLVQHDGRIRDSYDVELELTKVSKSKKPLRRKKAQKNIEIESGEVEPRRSKRVKFPPLDRWRRQRLQVIHENGDIVGVKVEDGAEPPPLYLDKIKKKKSMKKKSKNNKLHENTTNMEEIKKSVYKTVVIDPQTGKDKSVYLHRPYDSLLWNVPPQHNTNDASYTIAKCFTGSMITFGYLEVGVGKEKREQHSPEYNIEFRMVRGICIKVCINKSSFYLKEFDSVIVPAGNTYSIHNRGRSPALLSFSTFRSPLFEHQYPNDEEED